MPMVSSHRPHASRAHAGRRRALFAVLVCGALCLVFAFPTPKARATSTAMRGPDVIVEPDDGMAPIYALLRQPRHRLDLVMYELVDPTVVAILEADAARGVRVRVILDRNRERSTNTAAYDALEHHGIQVAWAPSSFEATHEKAIVLDAGSSAAEAAVMTLNLTARYYRNTRDVAVTDRDRAQVAAVEATFTADLAAARHGGNPAASGVAGLVWSPGSQAAVVALIGQATSSVAVENEEMSDRDVVGALTTAARRGVRVTVVMTEQSDYREELAQLTAAGVEVGLYPDTSSQLYIHAKVIVVDNRRAFAGSENFSTASLLRNRELGLVSIQSEIVGRLASVVAADLAGAPIR